MTRVSLEPDEAQREALLDGVRSYVGEVLRGLPDAPASVVEGYASVLGDPDVRRLPGEDGRAIEELLDVIRRAASVGFNPASPGYLAFIPGGGLVSAAAADLVADVLNRYTGVAYAAPGLVALEADVLRWMADLFGLPAQAAGILTTGGSLAALSAIVTARSERLGEDFASGRVYLTAHTHASIAKAVRLAGFPAAALRTVDVDDERRMDLRSLRAAISEDRAAGAAPLCIVANAGSTDTGTVDPLAAIGEVARDEGLWLHVDAAYGGFFQLTERGRTRLRGIEAADSIVLDPHKGLFLPFGTGALLVRDGAALRRAHSGDAGHYLQDVGDVDLPSFADYSPELSRDNRGLRVWLPLHLHGVAAFRTALDEKLDLALMAHDELAADPNLVVPLPPDLSVVVFRCRADDPAVTDARTRDVLARVNAEQRVLLSSTTVDGRYVGRICVLSHRSDRSRVAEAVDAVRRHAAAVAGGAS